MEDTKTPEVQKYPEVISGKYQIHFEPGVHSFPLADMLLKQPTMQDLRNRFNAGDLTAHAWNPQVAERMSQYGPLAIGLDSVSGTYLNHADPNSWIWLPGSPKEMTGRNEVYIVGGDLLHFDLLQTIYNQGGANWQNDLIMTGHESVREYAKGTLGIELVGEHIVLPIAMLLAYHLLSNKNKKEEDQGVKNPGRRLFLKKAAATVGALSIAAFLGRLMPLMQSYSPTSSTEDLTQKITDITKPFTRSTWLEGRTALVIAKTAEAMDKLGLPQGSQGSVVMGFPHAYEAGNLLTSKKARMEAIRKYAQEFFDSIYPTIPDSVWDGVALSEMFDIEEMLYGEEFSDKVKALSEDIKKNKSEEWKKSHLMDHFLFGFTSTVVYKIKEPNSYQVNDPKEAIKNLIQFEKSFDSQEVIEAVSPLAGDTFQQELKRFYQNNP